MPSQATNTLDSQLRKLVREWCERYAPTHDAETAHTRLCVWLEAQEREEQAYWIDKGLSRCYDQMIAEDGE